MMDQLLIKEEPFYMPFGDELEVAQACYEANLPILLKGPTGCGKTRFMEYLAWTLKRPLVTVSCHDDLSANDLVGRYLLISGETQWTDGPLTLAVRHGAICYLDEVVEARKDTTVIIHPLTDHRRMLPLEKKGELLEAAPGFMLAVSYNPGYQSALKDMKPSTRQRFVAIEFQYPSEAMEIEIIVGETGIAKDIAARLVRLAHMTRDLKDQGLIEGASTRLLVHCARLVMRGIDKRRAVETCVLAPLTDDMETLVGLKELSHTLF